VYSYGSRVPGKLRGQCLEIRDVALSKTARRNVPIYFDFIFAPQGPNISKPRPHPDPTYFK
jgi:hypothetical protein